MRIDIGTRNFEADDKIRNYVMGKIGGLEKYLPRRSRGTVRAQVLLETDPNGREDNRFVAEVIMTLPGAKFVSREGTLNMYAAVDIVEAKIKVQACAYKDRLVQRPRRARLLSRWLGRAAIAEPTAETEPSV